MSPVEEIELGPGPPQLLYDPALLSPLFTLLAPPPPAALILVPPPPPFPPLSLLPLSIPLLQHLPPVLHLQPPPPVPLLRPLRLLHLPRALLFLRLLALPPEAELAHIFDAGPGLLANGPTLAVAVVAVVVD